MKKDTQVVNGTTYSAKTPQALIAKLENFRENKIRARFFYGDQETGRDWMEEYDTMGTIGRSTGESKIPLLIKSKSSMGGSALMDDCIVKITVDGTTVYKHSEYHQPEITIEKAELVTQAMGYTHSVLFNGTIYANLKSEGSANRFAAFMKGERNIK